MSEILAEAVILQPKDHVILTARDLDMFMALHEHVVLSFMQIQNQFFAGRRAATVTNRLRKLEEHSWITRIRVPRFKILGQENMSGVVFQLSTKGRQELAKAKPSMDVFEKCPVISPHQLDHDLLITDIAKYFKIRYPDCSWMNGRYLAGIAGLGKIPDAALFLPNSDKVIAIELELTGKSNNRYVEIVTNFKASPRIARVIYVTANTAIGRKVMSAIEGYQVPVGHRLRSDLFEFVGLEECLKAVPLVPLALKQQPVATDITAENS